MKPISPAKGPAICPAAVACYALSVLQKSLYAGQVQQTSAQGKASPPLEFRHPHEEHVELTKWNLSFSIKSRRITLAANPCNKAADAPNTDLIYHFKQPEYSHHNEKSGVKTGKIPYGTNRKKQEQTEEYSALQDREELPFTSTVWKREFRKARWCHPEMPGGRQIV